MATYRNKNTGQEVSLPYPSGRLEVLSQWEQIEDPQPAVDESAQGDEPKLTGDALDAAAAEAGIEGRSAMTADQKREAVASAEAEDDAQSQDEAEAPPTREQVVATLQGAKVDDLKVLAKERDLDASGKHDKLVERIADHVMAEQEAANEATGVQAVDESAQGDGGEA